MRGSLFRVMFGQDCADSLMDEPHQPKRHDHRAALIAAFEGDRQQPAAERDNLGQFPHERSC